jgi:hypothetical protein
MRVAFAQSSQFELDFFDAPSVYARREPQRTATMDERGSGVGVLP